MVGVASTASRINFFYMVSKLVLEAQINDIRVMPFSFFRTAEEQKKLFDSGKSKCDGIIKKSKHQSWCAIDLVIVKNDRLIWEATQDYTRLGEIWENMGGVWGGRFSNLQDVYHFEI